VRNLRLRDVQFIPADGDARSAIALDQVDGFDCPGLHTPEPKAEILTRS
jgi:hypothetical protein